MACVQIQWFSSVFKNPRGFEDFPGWCMIHLCCTLPLLHICFCLSWMYIYINLKQMTKYKTFESCKLLDLISMAWKYKIIVFMLEWWIDFTSFPIYLDILWYPWCLLKRGVLVILLIINVECFTIHKGSLSSLLGCSLEAAYVLEKNNLQI